MADLPTPGGSAGSWGGELNAWLTISHTDGGMPRAAQAIVDADYELSAEDNGKILVVTADATTITAPADLEDGFQCQVVNDTGSPVQIDVPGGSVSLLPDDFATIVQVNGVCRAFTRTPAEDPSPPPPVAQEKNANYTLAPSDHSTRIIATAPLTITVPEVGTLGTGFSCDVVNDSGGQVTIDGSGAVNVDLEDGDVSNILELHTTQRVVVRPTTIVSIGGGPVGDVTWTPNIFGVDPVTKGLDITHWWDTSDPSKLVFDEATGKLSSWGDKVDTQTIVTQTVDSRRPTVEDGEVRFSGAGVHMVMPYFPRPMWENVWTLMLFRVNWSQSGAGADGHLMCVGGITPNVWSAARSQPRVDYFRASQRVQVVWTHTDCRGVPLSPPVTNAQPVDVAGDDVWHSMVARRTLEGAYISIDGSGETFIAGDGRMTKQPTGSQPVGFLGDGRSAPWNFVWGLDTLIIGQSQLNATEVEKLHAWALHRRGAQAQLPGGSPYLEDPPTIDDEDEIHRPVADSYSTGLYLGNIAWDPSTAGQPLSLAGMTETFSDHFTSLLTITDGTDGDGPWYAPGDRHDTTKARFVSPLQTPTNVFSLFDPTTLQIMMKLQVGFEHPTLPRHYSGHIQTVDVWGNGWTQATPPGGAVYYEARIACNQGSGWPAFWLYTPFKATDTTRSLCELDIMEIYGDNPTSAKQLHIAAHRHDAYRPQPGNAPRVGGLPGSSRAPSNIQDVTVAPYSSPQLFDGAGTPGTFHRYGLRIDNTWLTYYFDGLVVDRFPVFPEALGELYPLVSLQAQPDPIPTVDTFMWVDYVKCYSTAP